MNGEGTLTYLVPKFFKFGIVGATGTVVNLGVFYALVSLGAYLNVAAICAFMVAVSSNYIWNHVWTFSKETTDRPLNFRYYFSYVAGNIVGLAVNLIVLNTIVYFFGRSVYIIAQGAGILSGMIFDFLFAKFFVFIGYKK